MRYFNLLLLFLFTSVTLAQSNFNSESLTVTKADLETNIFEKDTTANALVIYEIGNSYIDKGSYKLITEIKKKIKILNRNGFEKSVITIYLYNNKKSKELIKDIKANTYNIEDGKITNQKLNPSDIFTEKYNDNNTIVKFTFPNVKEGSVITYSYTLESPFIYKYKDWHFQSDIPKLHSEYKTSIPGNYEYNIKLVGLLPLDDEKKSIKHHCLESGLSSANCAITTYVMKDIPSFIEEGFMTNKNNYLSRIDYELKVLKTFDGRVDKITKSWETVDQEIESNPVIGRQLKKINIVKDVLNNEIINISDPFEKAKAIYQFVQENYTWNKKFRTNEASIKNLLKNKSGNIFEINTLLHNILKQQNIEVKPVLLSTRKHGFVTKIYPVISDFNYLITQVTINNQSYLLDASDKYLAFGEIPFRCLNQYGRRLGFKNGSEWIEIKVEKSSIIQHQINLKITHKDSIKGSVKSRYTGYHALSKKKEYFESKTHYLENLENNHNTLNIKNHNIESEKSENKFQENYEIVFEDNEDIQIGDKVYLDPFIYKFFDKNPFKLQERTYPIDFGYKNTYSYSLKIDLGDLYEVIEYPKDVKMKLPNNAGSFLFFSKYTGNEFSLFLKISFSEAIYSPGYYAYLKEFMNKVVDAQINSLVVLKKK